MHVSQSEDSLGTDHYAAMQAAFRWQVPSRFNMAQVCGRRWADREVTSKNIAVIDYVERGSARFHSYSELVILADRLSALLTRLGVQRGDRVAIVLPQRFETAVAYMAVLQLGAVAMPLSQLFGPEALAFRLNDSEARVALCDEHTVDALWAARPDCPGLLHLVGLGQAAARCDVDGQAALAQPAPAVTMMDTAADDPAVLIYTSGTTGNPKGALIPHRALLGNLTGFLCSQNFLGFGPDQALDGSENPRAPSVFWSPADWAWTGGLMDALLPCLYFGRPIVACRQRFSPELALRLMAEHRVTHSFLFPTALKALMKAYPSPRTQFDLHLQAIMSAGEAVGDAVFAYCRDELGVTVNEMFGQTEINYIVGNCAMNGQRQDGRGWPAKPGSMGKGYPGHRVAVIDEQGQECPVGVPGDVALHRLSPRGEPDPIIFLGYWRNDTATQGKYTGDWCRTGDLAVRDADGYLWYQGRSDDVFKSAGYRIGPSEIENCLVKHPAVANAAVVPKPDRERGALVKAYVVIASEFIARYPDFERGRSQFESELVVQLQAHVKSLLAPYEYPKEIEFVDQLPMTTTGKVQRRVLRLQEEERARTLGLL